MPELPEVEAYRLAATAAVGRPIESVEADDSWYLKNTDAGQLEDALLGAHIEVADRLGKLLLLPVSSGHVLGLRFGMSGRLMLDTESVADDYAYMSKAASPQWTRFKIIFENGWLAVNDARRLGGVELDPSVAKMGPDALTLSAGQLNQILTSSSVALKARLLDQSQVAGVGNLIADELLWRANLDPARPAQSLSGAEIKTLHRQLKATVKVLMERGGSHAGDLMPERVRSGRCPRDGAELVRRAVGGRTTYSCPQHQR